MTDYTSLEVDRDDLLVETVETTLIDPEVRLPLYPDEEVPLVAQGSARGTIVVLHGFNPFPWEHPQSKFRDTVNQIRHDWDPRGYRVVAPTFDSLRPFPECAGFVALQLRNAGIRRNVHFVGYSMGGLVARVLAFQNDIEATSMTTICTPHKGTAAWVPGHLHSDGSRSMFPGAPQLRWLNDLTNDQAKRPIVRTMGVHYVDSNGKAHNNDQLIELPSQLGAGLGFRNGVTYQFYERRNPEFGKIHSECQHFPMMQYFLPRIEEHIRGMEQVMGIA